MDKTESFNLSGNKLRYSYSILSLTVINSMLK